MHHVSIPGGNQLLSLPEAPVTLTDLFAHALAKGASGSITAGAVEGHQGIVLPRKEWLGNPDGFIPRLRGRTPYHLFGYDRTVPGHCL